MANAEAFNSGWSLGQGLAEHQRARKEGLADEERQLKVQSLLGNAQKIQESLKYLSGDDLQKAKGSLTDIHTAMAQIYAKHSPETLRNDLHRLAGLFRKGKPAASIFSKTTEAGTPEDTISLPGQAVTIPGTSVTMIDPISHAPVPSSNAPVQVVTGPQPVKLQATPAYQTVAPKPAALTPQQRQGVARREKAQAETEQDVTAAGVRPEQQAEADARAKDITQSLDVKNAMRRYDELRPDSSKEDRDRFQALILETMSGIKAPSLTGKWATRQGTMNGQKASLMYNEKDGRWTYLDGSTVPEELLRTFVPDAAKPVHKLKAGQPVPSPQSPTGWAQIWVDPTDPQNKAQWAWTPSVPGRYQQVILSQSEQTDPLTGLVTRGLRKTGPAQQPMFDLTGIGAMPEGAGEPAPSPAAASPPAEPKASAVPASTPHHLRTQVPAHPVVTDPGAPVGTYSNPLPLDPTGHVPETAKPANLSPQQWSVLKTAADRLLDGALPKDLGMPDKVVALAQGLAGKFGWQQGLFTPKDKLLIREAGSYLKSMRGAPSLKALENLTSREKMHNAIQAADGQGGFFSSQLAMMFSLSHDEQDFVQRFLQARGTVSGLSQLTRGGRTTEAGIKRLQAELPDPLNVHSAADAQMRLDRLLSEIDVAQKQGFITDMEAEEGSLVDKIDKLLGAHVSGGTQAAPASGRTVEKGSVITNGNKSYRYKGTGAKNDLKNYDEVPNAAPVR